MDHLFLPDESRYPFPPKNASPLDLARYREFVRVCTERQFEWISNDLDIQERYLDMRLQGQSHNMAEILASRRFPGTKTDVEWNRGHCNGNQFDGPEAVRVVGDYYKSVAAEHGVSITGKVYKSGLADFPGDPEAWVSSRSEAQALIEKRGWSSQGLVEVAARPNDAPNEAPAVDPNLIATEAAYRQANDQMMGCKSIAELSDKLTKIRGHKPDHEIGKEID